MTSQGHVLPEGWHFRRVGSVGSVLTGSTPPTAVRSFYGNAKMFAGPADLGGSKYVTRTGKRLSPSGFARSRKFPAGSTLFVCIGSTIGKVGIIMEEMTANQQINAVIPGRDVNPQYLYYALSTISERVKNRAGEQAVPLVNKSEFSEFEILVPPLREQRAIADVLSNVDDLIGALGQLIAKKQAIKQGMMQQLLTGRTRFSGFISPWTEAELQQVAVVDPETLSAGTNPGAAIDYISLEDVSRGTILRSSRLVFKDAPSRARRVLRHLDVLFGTVRPNLQSHAIYQKGLTRPIASTGFAVVRALSGSADPAFLFYLLMSRTATVQVDRIIAGSNYPAISSTDVRKLRFIMPTLAEQSRIGLVLGDCDREITALLERLDKARAIKHGMMQELLTGRTRLPINKVAS